MSGVDFTALDARARGLALHLFSRAELEQLAASADLAGLSRALAQSGLLAEPVPARPQAPEVELAIRRTSVHLLRLLERWSPKPAALEVFYAEQDRRSLRAMLRGALQGAPAETRLAGLIPTPQLPERALAELARQPTPAKVAAHLFVLQHPDAPRLVPLTSGAQVVPFDLELALVRGYVERAGRAAREGDPNLRAYVRQRVDLCNVELALLFASDGRDVDLRTCFVEGGEHLDRLTFVDAASAKGRELAADKLWRALANTPLESVGAARPSDPGQVERAALVDALRAQHRLLLHDPLGSAPLLIFLLRLQAQQLDLQRIAWGAALGAPAAAITSGLAMPWS